MGCGALFGVLREQPFIGNEGSTDNLAVVEDTVRPDRNSFVTNAAVPEYWHNKKTHANDEDAFDDMFYVPDAINKFDELLAQSYVAKATQDRPCPKIKDPHARTPGGCPCVQPGADPGLPVAFRVLRVIRVEASSMWSKYDSKHAAIRRKRGECSRVRKNSKTLVGFADGVAGSKLNLNTSNVVERYKDTFDQLDSSSNEVYTFHGTFVRAALAITQTDFKINLAGSNRGGLFGKGLYFTDSITKADEYSKDEPEGYYEGVFAVLVCRVCMGLPYHTKDDQKAWQKTKNGEFDSTFGQRMFRELVVYDANQAYPEYVVLYRRIYQKDAQAYIDKLLRHQFFMEIPLHWRNNAKTLSDGFLQQHRGTSHLNEFLQTLIDRSLGGHSHKVKGSSRIENSVVWERYVNFKNHLRTRLGGKDGTNCNDYAFAAVQEDIDMCRFSNDAGASSLARAAGYRLPVDELDHQLNEHLLWFGGTEEQSERLTRGAFNKEDNREVFFSSLDDALSNVQSEEGMKYTVLCRVVCGQTDQAYPDYRSGLPRRELSISLANQVYPEYLIELFSDDDLEKEEMRKKEVGKENDPVEVRGGLEALLMPELRTSKSNESIENEDTSPRVRKRAVSD